MAITPITKEEFPGGESKAVLDLEEETGIKFPCRWKHSNKPNQCSGVGAMRNRTRKQGQPTTLRCKDGTVYAWRAKGEVNPDDNPIPPATN